jgi:SlyX protein
MTNDLEARIQVLEELLAHRDQELQDLSDMVSQQWNKIEELKRDLTRTKDRLITLEDEVGESPAADQKPPHW